MNNVWHAQSPREAMKALGSHPSGLSIAEAAARLIAHGANTLPEEPRESWASMFLRQFASPLIAVLLGAGLIVVAMGDMIDAGIIFGVLIFNALIGALQEGKAQRSLDALKQYIGVMATVRREGREVQIPDTELVPGDVMVLREGERVSADARVMTANALQIDEAPLTGESFPVRKTADAVLVADAPVADRRNMVYRGTSVLSGNALALVVATGSRTVIGGIAKVVAGPGADMPLKASLAALSRGILLVVTGCLVLLFALGFARGLAMEETFIVAVSLAVSVIPEGLPIVMTIILATGVWRMARRHVLVRKLQAVEALGRATVIAVDKTGTITRNEIMVERVVMDDAAYTVNGVGYRAEGTIRREGKVVDAHRHADLRLLATMAAAGAGAEIVSSKETGGLKVIGDPTEAAMGVFAKKVGIERSALPIIESLPFSYQHKFQAVVLKYEGKLMLAVIGAPEVILRMSDLSSERMRALEEQFLRMSDEGLRVVACARGMVPEHLSHEGISSISFVGFLGMSDTVRREAPEAVARSRRAGLRVVMMTGDHARTAIAVARKVGIFRDGDEVLEGAEVEHMTAKQLAVALGAVTVFARVTPESKMRIVKAYRERGDVVAMTGDGVNDVPPIVAADLGVAMGKIGTEVTKSAADIVLLDDHFGNIVHGVEEGRYMYVTLKKVVMYLLSTSLGEMLTILLALAVGLPLPILAAQIIWLNLVTDTFLTLALAVEPKESELLDAASRPTGSGIVDRGTVFRMTTMAIPMAVGSLWLFRDLAGMDLAKGWTMSLTALSVFQWFNAWNCRSESRSVFAMSPISNRPLVWSLFIVIGLQLLAVYHPFFQRFLRTVPLTLDDWMSVIAVSVSVIAVEEVRKWAMRMIEQRKTALG